jgi:hypothetical protein
MLQVYGANEEEISSTLMTSLKIALSSVQSALLMSLILFVPNIFLAF